MKLRSLFIPLLFAAVVLSLAYVFTDLGKLPALWTDRQADGVPSDLELTYESRTLAHVDPIYGYSFRYPLGYPLLADDGQGASFFAVGPSGLSESFVYQIVNDSYSAEELASIGREEFRVDPESVTTVPIEGRKILRLYYVLPKDEFGEPLHIVQGLVPCGRYHLYFVASVPQSLQDDVRLADYSLLTAQCGPSPTPVPS